MAEHERVLGGWITTVYGTVYLCNAHLDDYPMRFGSDNKVVDRMVVCEVCHPDVAIERPKKFGEQPRHTSSGWVERLG